LDRIGAAESVFGVASKLPALEVTGRRGAVAAIQDPAERLRITCVEEIRHAKRSEMLNAVGKEPLPARLVTGKRRAFHQRHAHTALAKRDGQSRGREAPTRDDNVRVHSHPSSDAASWAA
jgi:hypothetical protein